MLIKRKGILGKIESCLNDFRNGRHETAIATLMTAIDATAAKRYPDMPNGKRFQKFLHEEVGRVLGGKYIRLGNKLTNKKGKPVGDQFGAIYHLCRCYVLHEESISDKIEFELTGDERIVEIKQRDGKLVLNYGFLNTMFHAVITANENKHIFTEQVIKTQLKPIRKPPP